MEIDAVETIPAPDAIFEEGRVRAVHTVLQLDGAVALFTIDAIDAELGESDTVTVHAVFASVEAVRVVAIAVLIRIEDQIAVLVTAGIVAVLAVLIELRHGESGRVRHSERQFLELVEERSAPVDVPSVRERVPLVRVPLFLVVDDVRLSRIFI
jgi:hypothetical protein